MLQVQGSGNHQQVAELQTQVSNEHQQEAVAKVHQSTPLSDTEGHLGSIVPDSLPTTRVERGCDDELNQAVPTVEPRRITLMSCEPPLNLNPCKEDLCYSRIVKGGDPLHEWYTSSDQDWDECCYVVPQALCDMQPCHSDLEQDECQGTFTLEAVSWPCEVDLPKILQNGMDRHRVLTQLLATEEEEATAAMLGDVSSLQKQGVAKLCRLETSNRMVSKTLNQVQIGLGTNKIRCMSRAQILEQDVTCQPEWMQPTIRAGTTASAPMADDSEEHLQTKTVPNDVVRAELQKWLPSIQAEYMSLTQESKAVRPISDKEFDDLII